MVGLLFTVTLLSILGAVGFLFAWMVRLASQSLQEQALEKSSSGESLPQNSSCPTKH
jgi:hypothetical protein